jgi:DNA-binding response OmpR family regulator
VKVVAMARILVVEHDADIRALVELRISADGHEVVLADGPGAALTAVHEHGTPDLAVVTADLGEDHVDGLLSELRLGGAGIPAVLLTAHQEETDAARWRARGTLCLAKPFTAASLRSAVHLALAGEPSAAA